MTKGVRSQGDILVSVSDWLPAVVRFATIGQTGCATSTPWRALATVGSLSEAVAGDVRLEERENGGNLVWRSDWAVDGDRNAGQVPLAGNFGE